MNKSLFTVLSILVCMIGLTIAHGIAQADPPGTAPDIKMTLALDKPTYDPEDRIMVNLGLVNLGDDEIMPKGWPDTDFWLLLQFFDDKGRIITSDKTTALIPPPPRVFPDSTGVLVQGSLVEILTSGWVVSFDPLDAYTYYPLEGRSGHFRVKAVVPAITFLRYEQTISGTKYAPRFPTDTVKWHGSFQSNIVSFTKIDDADGDGYYYPLAYGENLEVDCDDRDASVNPGADEIPGNGIDDDCNPETPDVVAVEAGTITVKFDLYTVYSGNDPDSTTCVGAKVAAFDKFSDCVSSLGFSWQNYQEIWSQCGQVAFGEIGESGTINLEVPAGHYYIIGVFGSDGDEAYCGVSASDVEPNQTIQRYLHLIVRQDGEVIPGVYHKLKVKGSELLIIQPQYVEWDDSGKTEELYPFVFESFESIDSWHVTTQVSPPKGFWVSDHGSLKVTINDEIKAIQFTIKDTGVRTKWVPTQVKYIIKHKGKTRKLGSKIDVKISE